MRYLLFIFYLLSYTTGFAALTLTILLFLKFRIQAVLYYVIWLVAFTGILIFGNVEYYRITILFLDDTYNSFWTILAHHLLYCIMFLTIPLFIFRFLNITFTLFHKIVFGVLFIYLILIIFIPYYYTGIKAEEAVAFGFKTQVWFTHGIMLYLFIIFLINYKNIKIKQKKIFMFTLMALYIIFAPAWIMDYFWNFNFQNFLRPLSSYNLFYFIWNLLTIIFLSKYLFFSEKQFSEETVSVDFTSKFGITPREKEIINMIARGYTNKMMASALGIAVLTVKNHVYNIYQKTKAKSKIDLINRINQRKQTAESRIVSILS